MIERIESPNRALELTVTGSTGVMYRCLDCDTIWFGQEGGLLGAWDETAQRVERHDCQHNNERIDAH